MTRRLLPASIYLLAAAILVLETGCAASGQPANAVSVRGRIEGGADLLSLGVSTTGTISQLLVKAGDHVEAGQVLLRVECRDLENEILARQSDLAASEAVLARVTHGSRPEEIAIGEANVNLAMARLHEAQKQFDPSSNATRGCHHNARADRPGGARCADGLSDVGGSSCQVSFVEGRLA
jgi:multidrug efflux pump subunit AcrA (membrane-fusion protein)